MNETLFLAGPYPVTLRDALLAAAALLVLIVLWLIAASFRARRIRIEALERQGEIEARLDEIGRAGAELGGRMQAIAESFRSGQADFARLVSDRLDNVGARVGAGLESSAKTTGESLAKLNERMAVIDAAQSRLAGLTQEVIGLKDILANKQTRGAFGQGRMEAIVRDGLPANAYNFQFTLSNKTRPDCVIHLPGDNRPMAIDAKFPLEAFSLLKDARSDEARKAAQARVRGDVGKHVKDIAERYLIAGETQDSAMLFVPSDSVYSDLVEHFDDVVQKAHRARIVIVSPSLLMMAIQVMRSVLRDAAMREQTHLIQDEVGRLLDDVKRLADRAGKLEAHFRQAQEDVAGVTISAEKIFKRGERIMAMEFSQDEAPRAIESAPAPQLRLAKGGE
ncbi:MAG TPA: DNA recombination protein RmuC [Roseiarcus sp.]|nr:DNA recombination protein RmuC [Roseiarcus sp.]